MSNLNDDEQAIVFNRTISIILKSFIPHETIVCDDKDPPWFDKRIKYFIQEGKSLPETFGITRNNAEMIICLNNINDHLALLIDTARQNFYSKIVKKFQNTQRSSKTYWSLFKIFLNNNNIPIIPPVYHKNEYVTDFKKNVELFKLFSNQ